MCKIHNCGDALILYRLTKESRRPSPSKSARLVFIVPVANTCEKGKKSEIEDGSRLIGQQNVTEDNDLYSEEVRQPSGKNQGAGRVNCNQVSMEAGSQGRHD